MQYPISHVTDSPKRSRPRHLIPIGLVIALFAFSLTHFLRRSSGTDEAQNRLERVQTWEALYGGEVVRIGKADSAWMGIQKTLGSALANATAISDTSGQSVELIGRSAQGNIL